MESNSTLKIQQMSNAAAVVRGPDNAACEERVDECSKSVKFT